MYNRLFTKILDSSIWLEDVTTRIVWITLLAAMDEDGYAHFSATENLAIRARVSLSDTEAALVRLMSPDSNSENPANEGRRVERVQGGFLVLNAPEHRKTMNREIQREQTRLRVARHREKQECNAGIVTSALQTVTPASASVTVSSSSKEEVQGKPNLVPTADDIYNAYPLKKERPQAIAAIKLAMKHYGAAFVLERTMAYAKARNGDMEFVPYPQKWFKREGFNDDPRTWKPKSNQRQPEKERAPTGEAYRIYQPPRP